MLAGRLTGVRKTTNTKSWKKGKGNSFGQGEEAKLVRSLATSLSKSEMMPVKILNKQQQKCKVIPIFVVLLLLHIFDVLLIPKPINFLSL